jgi:hypothetical protein
VELTLILIAPSPSPSSLRHHAHLHLHLCAIGLILIFIFAPLRSSSSSLRHHTHLHLRAVALIFIVAPCAHVIIAPSSAPSSLQRQAPKLHRCRCAITHFASLFVLAPSRSCAQVYCRVEVASSVSSRPFEVACSVYRRAVEVAHSVYCLSWKCRRFRCCPQLVLTTWCRVFPTRRPDMADVSATSCDVGFFFLCRMSCRYLIADMSW